MKIAQISPPFLRTPPERYGGTELIVSQLTEQLVKRGHEITLYATGDSITKAKLRWTYPTGLGFGHGDPSSELNHVASVYEHADEFDIIHNHSGAVGLLLSRFVRTPVLTTFHNDYLKGPSHYLGKVGHLIAISQNQRERLSELNFFDVIHHGIDASRYELVESKDDYLVHIANICPEKGTDLAVRIAQRTGLRLFIVGKIDPGRNRRFFREKVGRHLDEKSIVFEGQVTQGRKIELLSRAKGLLMPYRWDEPFGLILAEALACGTPILATNRGSSARTRKN
jgi:glycosyltransferase involved in cell wall biosynthesis